MCLLAIYMNFFEKCLLSSSAHSFFYWVVCFCYWVVWAKRRSIDLKSHNFSQKKVIESYTRTTAFNSHMTLAAWSETVLSIRERTISAKIFKDCFPKGSIIGCSSHGFFWSTSNIIIGNGQGGLACYSPWGHKESDTTEQISIAQHNIKRPEKDKSETNKNGEGRGWIWKEWEQWDFPIFTF